MSSPLIVITGPTASGKSALAMEAAKLHNGELICADSRTVYMGMDIGTAKPSAADQAAVKHHLLDMVQPDQPFTAAQFKRLALEAIDDISSRGKLPIIVGGTGLYVDSVIFDYQFGDPADPRRREELQSKTIEELQQICLENGYTLPENIKNRRHLVRAIEVGGVKTQKLKLRPNTLVVAITTERDILHSRIAKRVHQMVQDGVVEEARRLGIRFGWECEALTGDIYRVMRGVIEGDLSLEEGIEQCIIRDRQLAKRQMTWLKRNPYIVWGDVRQLSLTIEHFVQQNKLSESIPEPS